jgi:predicted SprT family Zn-dependent metalloprotease
MNPDTFTGRIDEDILSTLAHEMAHVWRQRDGTPPRRAYHDRQWAAKMREIGL